MRQAVSLWRSRKSDVVKLPTLQGGKVQIANKIGRHKILKQRFHQQWIAEEIFVQCIEWGRFFWRAVFHDVILPEADRRDKSLRAFYRDGRIKSEHCRGFAVGASL